MSKLFHFFLLSETSNRADAASVTRGPVEADTESSMPPLALTRQDSLGDAMVAAGTSADIEVRHSDFFHFLFYFHETDVATFRAINSSSSWLVS